MPWFFSPSEEAEPRRVSTGCCSVFTRSPERDRFAGGSSLPSVCAPAGSGTALTRPMFANRLSCSTASLLPVFSRDGFRSGACVPAPHPWWSGRHLYTPTVVTRTSPPQNMRPGFLGGRSLAYGSARLMTEHRDKEPLHKRRKSSEVEEAGWGGQQPPGTSRQPRPDQACGDGTVGRTKFKPHRDSSPHRGRSKEAPGGSGPPRFTDRDLGEEAAARHTRPDQDRKPRVTISGQIHQTLLADDSMVQLVPAEVARRQPPPVLPLQRQWLASPGCGTGLRPPGVCTAFEFSVMSYNILSQQLLQDNAYLYRHCPPGVLPWDYRLPNLLSEIRQHNADILCLQEVQEDHYEGQLKPALQTLGYSSQYKKRTGNKPDGCATFYKSSRLSLISSNPVEFFRAGDDLLDRDNVGLIVLLRPNGAAGPLDSSICVANTHLLFNPRRGDIKLAQLAVLLAEIRRLSRVPDGSAVPVVLCGDLNATPWSPLLTFLTEGCLDYQGLLLSTVSGQQSPPRGHRRLSFPIWSPSLGINSRCQYEATPPAAGAASDQTAAGPAADAAPRLDRAKLEHGLKLESAYQRHRLPDGRREITTCHYQSAKMVDYILFTSELSSAPSPVARGLQLLGRLSLVGESELQAVNGLPNRHHSSDHLPLLARFLMRK